MFYKIKNDSVYYFSNHKVNKDDLYYPNLTMEEYQNDTNKYIVGDIEIEIEVPDFEEQEVTKEIEVPDFETVTKTEEILVGEDEEGNPIFETKEWQEEVQTGTHTETVTEIQTIQVGSHIETKIVKGLVLNPNYDEEKAQEREEQFNKDFFYTSLGYIRRKVSMATGEIKDFLSDLLPTISMGVQMGSPVQIITYDKPDFTKEITDWTALQSIKTVTAEFIQECFTQLSNDFKPVNEEGEDEDTTDTNE